MMQDSSGVCVLGVNSVSMDERDLAKLCLQGDAAARKELYARYAPSLFKVCLRYAPDRAAAEDTLHDGFIKIFDSINKYSFKEEGSLAAWCRRVMVNLAIDRLRKEKKLQLQYTDRPPEPDTDGPPASLVRRIPPEVLQGFINELPPGYRTIFNLFAVDGLPHREIARMLGIKENSSSSQYARAKQILAHKIKNWLNNAAE